MLNSPFLKDKDKRRELYDWASGDGIKSVKAVVVLEELPIGDHYHLNKDEMFLLLQGKFKELVVGNTMLYNVEAPYRVLVPKGTYHKFVCEKGSILMGVASAIYDPKDEIKAKSIIDEHY